MSKASKAARAKAVSDAIATMRRGRATSAKVARDEVTDDHLVSIATGTSPIVPGMSRDLAATLADVERRATKLVHPRTWGDQPTIASYEAKSYEAKAEGAGRIVGARADEASMVDHIASWVGRYGAKAPSKASREYQRLNPGKGCWPVYRRLWGEAVANPTEVLKGHAMTSKAATYADASFVTSFAEYVAAAVADEAHEHHALAVQVAAGAPVVEAEPVAEPVAPKAPAKAKRPAKAPARKATTARKAKAS